VGPERCSSNNLGPNQPPYSPQRPIGAKATGAVAALPIWVEIMQSWVDRRLKGLAEPPHFLRPSNVVFVDGEAYVAGTEPGGRR
jgi:membrane carboxypeptidase/penicillin-binding protein